MDETVTHGDGVGRSWRFDLLRHLDEAKTEGVLPTYIVKTRTSVGAQ